MNTPRIDKTSYLLYPFLVAILQILLKTNAWAYQEVAKTEWVTDRFSIKDSMSWVRHTIDNSSIGADGVKLSDANGDGLLDIVSGWEEGGVVRVYLHPGANTVKDPWPVLEVGQVDDVEDAVFVDVNADGILDVVSATEGSTRNLYAHIAPDNQVDYARASLWETVVIPAASAKMQWMFTAPGEKGKVPVKLVAAGKGADATIGWFGSSTDADLIDWKWQELAPVGWVMSILWHDTNGDGVQDIVYSDRKNETRGVYVIENNSNPGKVVFAERKYIGGADHELMFMAIGDITNDGLDEYVIATQADRLVLLRQDRYRWQESVIFFPSGTGTGKGIAIGDIDGDGLNEIVISCEHALDKIGVFYLDQAPTEDHLVAVKIANQQGIKFDRIELIDIDSDGDLDVLTCEEKEGLGIVWYENPLY